MTTINTTTDLFDQYGKEGSTLPAELTAILDKYQELENDYQTCGLMLKECEAIGYTFDYYLDAEPYDLRPIEGFNPITEIREQFKDHRDEFIVNLDKCTTKEEIFATWRYNNLMTATKRSKAWDSVQDLKDYVISRYDKEKQKQYGNELLKIKEVLNAPDLESVKISVEWKRSATWGSNPTAEAWYSITEDSGYIQGSSIGGCGYDKLSTAVAGVLNQIPSLLKHFYLLKDANINVKNHDLFGYGSGYGILPNIEGGVGVSCYDRIFQSIGYEFKSVASGKSYDVYQINKLA